VVERALRNLLLILKEFIRASPVPIDAALIETCRARNSVLSIDDDQPLTAGSGASEGKSAQVEVAASRARSSGLITLPVGLRGRASTKTY
jgi:hypothetical protein